MRDPQDFVLGIATALVVIGSIKRRDARFRWLAIAGIGLAVIAIYFGAPTFLRR
jgi:hypothetical protein